MKFYDCSTAPSPRRVRIFLAEKSIELPMVNVDLAGGEQFSEAFRRRNPACTVPVLELDDGTCIHEVNAICRYIEEAYPEPPLMGDSPKTKALVEMWNHHMEIDGFLAVAEGFRNRVARFKDRALTGAHPIAQIPALSERGRRRYAYWLQDLDERLAASRFIAGDCFSVADITALVTVDFGTRALKLSLPQDYQSLRRWHHEVGSRPSAEA